VEKPGSNPSRSDFVETMLRTPAPSRVVEIMLSSAPHQVFSALWRSHFKTRLGRLIGHPVANFVVAKGIARLDSSEVKEAVAEVSGGEIGSMIGWFPFSFLLLLYSWR
jgi:nucleolar protein 9